MTLCCRDKDQPTFHHIEFHGIGCINKISESVCRNEIHKVIEIKYLDIYIDSTMKWMTQILELRNKLRKTLYKFEILRNIFIIIFFMSLE